MIINNLHDQLIVTIYHPHL